MEELKEQEGTVLGVPETQETAEVSADTPGETGLWEEAAALKQSYPDFDLEDQMKDPLFKGLVEGAIRPDLRMIYELCHSGEITQKKVEAAVSAAVAEAVEQAVAAAVERTVTETEQRMLSRIRARGQRPAESGLNAALGVRAHPAVGRLTRDDRERLARRASRGETIRL